MCDGYGHCRELAPELVTLDEWGYPILSEQTFVATRKDLIHSAQLAVRGCPRQALWLEQFGPRN